MNDTDLKRIYDSIDELDAQYNRLSESIAMLKVTTDNVSIDNRAINTSIHNLSLSLGGLKERTDAVVSSLKMLAESKDDRIASALRESGVRFTDFRSLCDSRVAATDIKFKSIRENIISEIEKIRLEFSMLKGTVDSLKNTLSEYEKKLTYGMYMLIINLGGVIIWLAKLYGETKGWL